MGAPRQGFLSRVKAAISLASSKREAGSDVSGSENAGDMQATMRAALEGVGGWLDLTEAWALHETARHAASTRPSAVIVEIGSYHGRSTIALAYGVKAGGSGRVFAVDPQANEPDQNERFLSNIDRAGVRDIVEPVRAFSDVARERFAAASIDVLFIDGPHNYGAVAKDIVDWTTALTDDAVIAFNDAYWVEGVRRAIRHKVTRARSPFRNPRWSFNTLFFDFKPEARWSTRDWVRLARVRAFLALGGGWIKVHARVARRSKSQRAKDLDFKLMMGTLGVVLPRV
jgi:predicted O-methyltransferase YrrM